MHKMRGFAINLSKFCYEFHKFNNIAARTLDSIDPQLYSGSAIHSVFTIIFIIILDSLFWNDASILFFS